MANKTGANPGPKASVFKQLKLAGYIARRIIRARGSPTLSLVTLISVCAIAVGIWWLIVLLSVTAGFESAFEDKILGLFPHLLVFKQSSHFDNYEPVLEAIRKTDGITGASPMTGDEMMVAHGINRSGATIQGVDLGSINDVVNIEQLLTAGSLGALNESPKLTRLKDAVTIDNLVEGTWTTVVVRDRGPPLWLFDDRTLPDAGHARVRLLDVRPAAQRTRTTLTPEGGDAVDVFKITAAIQLIPHVSGGAGTEVAAGIWRLDPGGASVTIEPDTLVTIVLMPAAVGMPNHRLMVEPTRRPTPIRTAHVRVVDARTQGEPLQLQRADGAPIGTATEPGEFTEFSGTPARVPSVLLGTALAKKLNAKVGDELTLVTPLRGIDNKMLGPMGMMPSSVYVQVGGIFNAGFHDHDSRLALINIDVSQRLVNRGKIIKFIAIRSRGLMDLDDTKAGLVRTLDPIELADLVDNTERLRSHMTDFITDGIGTRRARAATGLVPQLKNASEVIYLMRMNGQDTSRTRRYQVFDWKEKNINLFSALTLQKVVLTLVFLIIIVVGSFVVVGSQMMIIHEKTAAIAILKAMGATKGLVRLVFTIQGLLVAGFGVIVGVLLALGMILLINAVDYKLEASIYLIEHLPARFDFSEVLLVTTGALLCTLLTTQISAGRAAAKLPVDGLRAFGLIFPAAMRVWCPNAGDSGAMTRRGKIIVHPVADSVDRRLTAWVSAQAFQGRQVEERLDGQHRGQAASCACRQRDDRQ